MFGSGDDGSAPMVHYTIRMPRSARLRVEDYKSATRVSGLESDLRLQTYKGTVEVSGQNGAVDLETYKGEVAISFAALAKPVRLQTYKGEIRLRLPGSSAFEVDADTGRRGDFETQFEMTTRFRRLEPADPRRRQRRRAEDLVRDRQGISGAGEGVGRVLRLSSSSYFAPLLTTS